MFGNIFTFSQFVSEFAYSASFVPRFFTKFIFIIIASPELFFPMYIQGCTLTLSSNSFPYFVPSFINSLRNIIIKEIKIIIIFQNLICLTKK
jgi:hypothetical protein